MAAVVAVVGLAACDGPEVVGGRLSVSGSGAHPAGVSVEAFSDASETVVAEVRTDAAGQYHFGAETLPAGTYRLRFNRDEWWGGTDWASATPVAVSPSAPPSVDATIAFRTGAVSGTIQAFDGFDLWYTVAVAENVLGGPTFSSDVVPQPDGSLTYEITGLPIGTYRVRLERVVRGIGSRQVVYSGSVVRSGATLYEVGAGSSVTAAAGVFPEDYFAIGTTLSDGTGIPFSGGALVLVDAGTLEPVGLHVPGRPPLYSSVPLVRARIYAPAPYRSGDYVGQSPTSPLGVVLDAENWVEYGVIELVGEDCDPSVFVERGDHRGEDLSGRNLINCDVLRLNDLRDVDLRGADLSRADLGGADLTGADLTGADVTGVNWVNATCPDGTYVESAEPGQPDGTCAI